MRTLIAVPCMDTVNTLFFTSMISLRKGAETEIAVSCSSLIYSARNMLAKKAIENGFDRVLWLDSDMMFQPDLLEKLSAHLDSGLEYVSAMYYTRKAPVKPCILERLELIEKADGELVPTAVAVKEYPKGLFRIAGGGFGAVMMTTELIKRCGPLPFFPMNGFGEDYTFCLKAREAGAELWCDGSIVAGHLGTTCFNEESPYLEEKQRKEGR